MVRVNLQAKYEKALVAFLWSVGVSHEPLKMLRFRSNRSDPSELKAQPFAARGFYGASRGYFLAPGPPRKLLFSMLLFSMPEYINYKNPQITNITKYELWNLYMIQNKSSSFSKTNSKYFEFFQKTKVFWHMWLNL